MAGDWIKMRTDLYRNPKVIMIADRLMNPNGDLARHVTQLKQCDMCVTLAMSRNVTVGALVSVWGVARQQGKRIDNDLVLKNASISIIDEISDVPGLGEAMNSVEWVVKNAEGIVFPGFFEEYNEDPNKKTKTGAERTAKWRQKKRDESDAEVTSQKSQSDVTKVTQSDACDDIEEKRREENSTPPLPPSEKQIPDGLNYEAWTEYIEYRKKSKLRKLQPKSVEKQMLWLVDQGDKKHQAAIVEQTTRNGYQGLFELKANGNGANQTSGTTSAADRAAMQSAIDQENIARGLG